MAGKLPPEVVWGGAVPVGGIVDLRDFALVPLNLEFVVESPRFYRRFCELLLPGLSCYYSDRRRGQLNNGGSRDGLLRRKDPPHPQRSDCLRRH